MTVSQETVLQDAGAEADNAKLPGTVFTPRQVRLLKFVVIGLGVVLVLGFLLVIVGMARTAMHLGEGTVKTGAAPGSLASDGAAVPDMAQSPLYHLVVPQGASVISTALDGDRLAVTLKTATGTEVAVFDLKRGKVVSRLALSSHNLSGTGAR